MEIALALIGTPAILAMPIGMIMLLFKKTRKNGLKISLISTAMIIVVAVALTGQKRPLQPKHVWAIRARLEIAGAVEI